ncbi:E3 SUMO-protein ligase ZBED1-like [Cydia fagiglandana]|uniref:E3 SUMO-protein ligase ZBED1-like n=1 Tax=Cydia fagiglandana TaxID=1458189 RepID=UPI002FEE1EF2
MSGSGERKSLAWQYFVDLKNNKAKCNFCNKIISYKGGGPYNLIRHTKSQHPLVFTAITERDETATNPPSTSTAAPFSAPISNSVSTSAVSASQPESTEPTPGPSSAIFQHTQQSQHSHVPATNSRLPAQKITDYLPKPLTSKKTETVNKHLVKLFAKNYLPFSLVESPEFKDFVRELNPNYKLPSRKTLSNVLVEKYYNITKERIKAELAESDHVALTTDGWSSDPNDNYISVTAHFINQEADLKAYALECAQYSDRHTAENLAQQLKKICDDWEISHKIVSVSTDNANNVKAAVRLNKWKQVSCFAHTLNLVQTATDEIKPTHQKVKRVVELFKRSPLACERLRTMQQNLGEPQLKVKQDVVTRWNSTFDMFERVLAIKNSLQTTLNIHYPDVDGLSSDDLEVLKGATGILGYFKAVTEEMSSERSVTISEVIQI